MPTSIPLPSPAPSSPSPFDPPTWTAAFTSSAPNPFPLPPASPSNPSDPLRSEVPRSPAHAGETALPPFPPRPRRDRWTPFLAREAQPTVFTPELITAILEEIERHGLSE